MFESFSPYKYIKRNGMDQENTSWNRDKPMSAAQFRSGLIRDLRKRMEENECGTEEERQREISRIRAKLKGGKKLSGKEMSFLKQDDPALYQQALRVQNMREQLKNRLRQCRSKEEAHNAIGLAFEGIADNDPAKEMMQAAVADVAKQFTSSRAYQKLPDTRAEQNRDEGKKEWRRSRAEGDPFTEDDEAEQEDRIVFQFSGSYQEAVIEDSELAEVFESWV